MDRKLKGESRKLTAIYQVPVNRYGAAINVCLRFVQKPGQTIMQAANEAAYKTQKKAGQDLWDIDSAITHIFEGWIVDEAEWSGA